MNKFFKKIGSKVESFIMPLSQKMNDNKHLAAVKNGMSILISLMIIGGFSMLIAVPPVPEGTTNTFLLAWQSFSANNFSILIAPYNLTIGMISLYIVFLISYELSKEYDIPRTSNAIIATFIFLLTSVKIEKLEDLGQVITSGNLGATGMFYAILVAFIVTDTIKLFLDKNIKIKMPEQVPPNVTAPFEALIPTIFLMLVFIVVDILSYKFTNNGISRLVYTIIQPLLKVGSSLPAVIILSLLLSLFWFFGIHGNSMISGILTPIITANLVSNAEFYATGVGKAAPLSGNFMTIFGNWMTYPAMVLCFFIVAKSTKIKQLRTVALLPDIFNINEPLTFGVPVMLNIVIALPIALINIFNCIVAYLIFNAELIRSIYISVPFTVPGIINLFLGTGGDPKSLILWIVLFIIDVLLLLPAVRLYDRQLLIEENNEEGIK